MNRDETTRSAEAGSGRGCWHIWRAPLDCGTPLNGLREPLSEDERGRLDRLRVPAVRRAAACSRFRLRTVLGEILDRAPASFRFKYGPDGKPCLAGEEVYFNLSHSSRWWVMIASFRDPVGIDIERVRPELDTDRLGRRLFGPEAGGGAWSGRAFFEWWVRWEALTKARGRGLWANRPGDPSAIMKAFHGPDAGGALWWCRTLAGSPGYALAVAGKSEGEVPDIVEHPFPEESAARDF
ncbi:4'-phosphopantetheinyl transferase family protein [Kiritimatiella glycovorans]|uniref:4'-phosphopantetheinyl transferase sfp n=1 Tax=Kiritimatiella glycovorans TaxID=1307763 RepID=A0A0G3EEI6_9BACT|nr:hypothetical protein [Kiritimatiella glycovorans]AKJ64866.1 4'-phosphopantetheinyl transferase sfp [Kiritimatiella glycovorans]